MSLLDDNRPTNPAKHFINVKNGALSYWDRESASNVTVSTPFEFVVLDQLATIKGWSATEETGIWSNEVKSVGQQEFNVRTQNGIKASGLWKDIKDELKIDGAKFNAAIYLAAKGREGLETHCLLLKGAALNAWIEFSKKTNLKTHKVVLSDWVEEGKAIKYKVPVFTAVALSDAELEEAKQLAVDLRDYHNLYFANAEVVADEEEEIYPVDEGEIDLSAIPF